MQRGTTAAVVVGAAAARPVAAAACATRLVTIRFSGKGTPTVGGMRFHHRRMASSLSSSSSSSRRSLYSQTPSSGSASLKKVSSSCPLLVARHGYQQQQRGAAHKATAHKMGDCKKDIFGHHTVALGDNRLIILPVRGLFNPFARAQALVIDMKKDTWTWESKTIQGKFPRAAPRGHLFPPLMVVGTSTRFLSKGKSLFMLNPDTFESTETMMLDTATQNSTKVLPQFMNLVSETTKNPDKLWFFGETYLNSRDDQASCEVAVWDRASNKLYSASANTLPVVGDGPKEKKDITAVTVRDKVYVIGADIIKTKLLVHVFDTERLEWTLLKTQGEKPMNPSPGYTATAVGNKILFLGYDMSLQSKTMDAFILDTDNNTWEQVQVDGDTIAPRFAHTTTYLGNNEFAVVGGKGYGYFSTSVQDFFKLTLSL